MGTATVFAFDESLVLPDCDLDTKEQVLQALSSLLLEKGYVRPSIPAAVAEREARFPTGLPTKPVAVAIPHVDPEHCVGPFLAVARLRRPVRFGLMGDPSATLGVSLVFMLGLWKAAEHVTFLANLTQMFQKEECLDELMSARRAADLVDVIARNVDLGGV